jgi:alcohol dehydrogenase, propanol-preferring
MRAMQLAATAPIQEKPLQLVTLPRPSPAAGQIRLKVSTCGVCHTDLHTVEGDLPLPGLPLVPGHQVVGIVDALGEGATRRRPGDRLGVAWLNWSCGRCSFCLGGLENLCPNARFTGLHAPGGYADYLVVDEAFAFPLPSQFSDEAAAPLLCAGIVGYRALRLSGIKPGGRLGLYGFGASAHLVIQIARFWECDVYVFSRSAEHRRHAQELGAAWAGSAEEQPPQALDAAVSFAPAGWIIPLALSHLRPGGALAVNAIHTSPIPEMPYRLIYGERVLRSVANFTRDDAVSFLELAGRIPVRTDVAVYPLTAANEVLQRLKASEVRGAAVLSTAF